MFREKTAHFKSYTLSTWLANNYSNVAWLRCSAPTINPSHDVKIEQEFIATPIHSARPECDRLLMCSSSTHSLFKKQRQHKQKNTNTANNNNFIKYLSFNYNQTVPSRATNLTRDPLAPRASDAIFCKRYLLYCGCMPNACYTIKYGPYIKY